MVAALSAKIAGRSGPPAAFDRLSASLGGKISLFS
jgi:hypothetical protein